jgi:hypothetical protein
MGPTGRGGLHIHERTQKCVVLILLGVWAHQDLIMVCWGDE